MQTENESALSATNSYQENLPDQLRPTGFSLEFFLNTNEQSLEEEYERLQELIRYLDQRAANELKSTPQSIVNTINHKREKNLFNKNQRIIASQRSMNAFLREMWSEADENLNSDPSSRNSQQLDIFSGLTAGGLIHISNLYKKRITNEARKQLKPSSDAYDNFLKLSEYTETGLVQVKIRNVSILDLRFGKPSQSDVFAMLMEPRYSILQGLLIDQRQMDYEQFKVDNTDLPIEDYPAIFRRTLILASETASTLTNLTPDDIQPYTRAKGSGKEAAKEALELVKRTNQIRDNMFDSLLNPENEQSHNLISTINQYLDDGIAIGQILQILKIMDNADNLRKIYRKAIKYSRSDNTYSDFYKKLANAITSHIETIPYEKNLPITTINDLETILEDSKPAPQTELDYGKIKKLTINLAKNALHYQVNTEKIELTTLMRPGKISLVINKQNPTQFAIEMIWQDILDEDEPITLLLLVDSKNQSFDWSLLDSPNSESAQELRNSLSSAITQILSYCQNYTEADSQDNDSKSTSPAQMPTTKPNKDHFRDPVYELRRLKSDLKQPRHATPLDTLTTEDFVTEADAGVKRSIFRDDATLENHLSNFPPEIISEIKEGINKFEQGQGNIKSVTKPGPAGQSLRSLRISTTQGPVRILLTKRESSANNIVYEVYKADWRKNIYRKI